MSLKMWNNRTFLLANHTRVIRVEKRNIMKTFGQIRLFSTSDPNDKKLKQELSDKEWKEIKKAAIKSASEQKTDALICSYITAVPTFLLSGSILLTIFVGVGTYYLYK